MFDKVAIAGSGQAGLQAAASLRQLGFKGLLTIIGNEAALPYQRPPLSKAYMLGKTSADALSLRPRQFFVENDIRILSETMVAVIDRSGHRLLLEGGDVIDYDHLVLALGARNRALPIPGAEAKGVYGLRSLADADAISDHLRSCQRIAIIGAGFIGLEFAAVATALGKTVHLFEQSDRVMSRAVSHETSAFFRTAHQNWGVNFHFGRSISQVDSHAGYVSSVRTSDGETMPMDMVLLGIGVLPNSEIAEMAGLETNNGIKVNAELLTSDPDISAIGDCAAFPLAGYGRHIRLESVQNAIDQGKLVAARLMGRSLPYKAVPWFWSDQRDLKLQIAGLSLDADRSVRIEDPQSNATSVLCFARNRLVAIESVNRGSDHMLARKILGHGTAHVTFQQAESAGFDLKACLAALA